VSYAFHADAEAEYLARIAFAFRSGTVGARARSAQPENATARTRAGWRYGIHKQGRIPIGVRGRARGSECTRVKLAAKAMVFSPRLVPPCYHAAPHAAAVEACIARRD
jgi:hypothetical protein